MKWKVLSSEKIFDDPWLSVRKDRCQTPKGIMEKFFVYEFPSWVTAACLTRDNQWVMVRQYRHGIGEIGIETPGGVVDDADKTLEDAARREVMEETGYSFDKYEYLGKISPNPSTNNNVMHLFLATGGVKTGEQKLDENEDIEIVLMSMNELKDLLRKNEIMQSMHVTCLFYALEKLGELKY